MRYFTCVEPTWTHADREASVSFQVLPGGIVAIDAPNDMVADWLMRNTATEVDVKVADVAVLTAEADSIARQVTEKEAEVVSLKSLQVTKNADLSVAVGMLEVM